MESYVDLSENFNIYINITMVHLSNAKVIGAMVFYSLLTFFLGPIATRPFLKEHPDQCVMGFLLGFTISVFLWMKYGRKLAK
jgi:hypothetical protein